MGSRQIAAFITIEQKFNKTTKKRWTPACPVVVWFKELSGMKSICKNMQWKIAFIFKQIKRDRIRFLYSVQGNGSWERAVR
ncbi:hypothetical protein [Leclercia sp. UBA2479]|uniref:hypothetical protein n=1 Tax=Leclercia sp. UBA2479 TaxID=1946738 RepID=UPI00062C2F64|nr:hypothetical protein [Leclercia sp. UBA2479]KKY88230.1 hypothetical protein OA46_06300 [Enterobacter cloacae]